MYEMRTSKIFQEEIMAKLLCYIKTNRNLERKNNKKYIGEYYGQSTAM
jgi:hypothetical protein